MTAPDSERFKQYIRTATHNGVTFYDIDPLLADHEVCRQATTVLAEQVKQLGCTHILGVDSRGFALAAHLAERLGMGWTMARKAGKTPCTPDGLHVITYGAEYGPPRTLELKRDLYQPTDRVLIVDDVLATGGTMAAMCDLVRMTGAQVAGVCVLITINGLGWQEALKTDPVVTLVHFSLGEQTVPAITHRVDTVVAPYPPLTKSKRIVLMSWPTMRGRAEEMVSRWPETYDHANINWDRFSDGSPNVTFESSLVNRDVVYIGSLYHTDRVLEQLMLTMVLPRQGVKSLTILYPFYVTGTMERVDQEGTLATADSLAAVMTSVMPMTKTGPATICIYDIHALQVRFYFRDNIRIKLLTAIDVLKQSVDLSNTVIVFPDDGAYKRFSSCFQDHPIIVCSKVRDGDQRKVVIKDRYNMPKKTPQSGEGLQALIVDDLVRSGGTLYECMQALRMAEMNMHVSAFVTHAAFPNNAWRTFLPSGKFSGFHRFYVCDTVPETTTSLSGQEPFVVLSTTEHFAQNLAEILDR